MALLSGYVALFAPKGSPLHRKVGLVFVYSMLVMAIVGGYMSVAHDAAAQINVPAAILTIYLVITSLTTVRPALAANRRLLLLGMTLVGTVAVLDARLLAQFLGGRAATRGLAIPFAIFTAVAVLALVGDIRVLRLGPLTGPSRIARHLWRMTFALQIAAMSFFIGQADVIPARWRIMPLLGLPVVVVLVSLFYWLWRVRFRRSLRGMLVAGG